MNLLNYHFSWFCDMCCESSGVRQCSMAIFKNKQTWKEFFQTYRDLPELWKVKSEEFKDKNKKKIAWQKLLAKYKEIEDDSSLEGLKQRVTNIRTCYRRELKKVERSMRLSTDPLDNYVPTLWYFEELDFLRDQGEHIFETSTIHPENELLEHPKLSELDFQMQKRRKTVDEDVAEKNQLLQNVFKHLKQVNRGKNERDDASIYSESWATSFRKISELQKIYAKKAIEDILILGQLGQLTLNSVPMPSSSCFPPEMLTPIHSQKMSTTPVLESSFSPSPRTYEQYNQNESQSPCPAPCADNIDIVIKRRDSL